MSSEKAETLTKAAQSFTRSTPRRISETKLFLLSMACAVAVANGYYIHPLIAPVGADFGVGGSLLGLVPALNQVALALGILLLLPLGDRINNRKLVITFAVGQLAALTIMALAQDFRLFVAASSLLGFATITPYLLPAYVTRRVRPDRIGHVTGIMSAGITVGLLGSRAGAHAKADAVQTGRRIDVIKGLPYQPSASSRTSSMGEARWPGARESGGATPVAPMPSTHMSRPDCGAGVRCWE